MEVKSRLPSTLKLQSPLVESRPTIGPQILSSTTWASLIQTKEKCVSMTYTQEA